MSSLNKVQIIGHLGRDPESRSLGSSGDKVVNLRVATTESWRDKQSGERKERTEWHSVVIFNEGLGKVATDYLRKGSKVYLEGQLQTRKWQDKDGNDRYSTEIVLQRFRGEMVLLDAKGENGGGRPRDDDRGGDRGDFSSARTEQGRRAAGGGGARDLDDDIPF